MPKDKKKHKRKEHPIQNMTTPIRNLATQDDGSSQLYNQPAFQGSGEDNQGAQIVNYQDPTDDEGYEFNPVSTPPNEEEHPIDPALLDSGQRQSSNRPIDVPRIVQPNAHPGQD